MNKIYWPLVLVCIYGIYTYIARHNPYLSFLSDYTSVDIVDRASSSLNDARGSLSGRITGTAPYTIQYGILMLLFIWLVVGTLYKRITTCRFASVLILMVVNMYLTGSRGPLFAMIFPFVIYGLRTFSFRKACVSLVLIFVISIWLNQLGVFSLVSDDVGGSSTSDRLLQMEFSMLYVTDFKTLLLGNGLGYSTYILQNESFTYGGFEGVILAGIINYGVLGLIFIYFGNLFFWWKLSYSLYKRDIINSDRFFFLGLYLFSFFLYSIIVGEAFGNLAFVIYILLIKMYTGDLLLDKNIQNKAQIC